MTDHINIGDTVDVHRPDYPSWFGEVTDEGPTMDRVWVRCIGDPADGTTTLADVAWLTRAGVVEWPYRDDGCDDVDVTGRVRPYHRHAATGEAHAHPGGGLAHTHIDQPGFGGATIGPRHDPDAGGIVDRSVPEPRYNFHELAAGAVAAGARSAATREQHMADMAAITDDVAAEGGPLGAPTVFAVLREIADNEPVMARTDGWLLCWYCEASSLPPPGRPQPVAHLISCPWRRVVEIVGVRPDQEVPTAPPVVCRCGHLESAHETQGWRACSYRDGCGCQLFTDREQTILPGDDFDPGDRGWVDE